MKLHWHFYRWGVSVSGKKWSLSLIGEGPRSISFTHPLDLFFLRKRFLQTGIGYNIRAHRNEHLLEVRLLGYGISIVWEGDCNDDG